MVRRVNDIYKYRVIGTGVTATDNAAFAKAVAYANTYGNVHVTCWGDIHIATGALHRFTKRVILSCMDEGAFVLHGTGKIVFGNNPLNYQSSVAMTAITAERKSAIVSPNLTLASGDYCAIIADNQRTGLHMQHISGNEQRCHEIHKVACPASAANTYQLMENYVDQFTLNPRIQKLTMIRGIELNNVRFRWGDGVDPTGNCMEFYQCADLKINGLTGLFPVPGPIYFAACHNVRIEEPIIESKFAPLAVVANDQYGYIFLVTTCTSWKLRGGQLGINRHGVTTGDASDFPGSYRYGTSLCCSVKGTRVSVPYNSVNGSVCFDLHPEGDNWLFEGIEFDMGHSGAGYAIVSRGRDTEIRNCSIIGGQPSGGGTNGILIEGPRNKVINTKFERLWTGIVTIPSSGSTVPVTDGLTVLGSHFVDMWGPGIWDQEGNNREFGDNIFRNVAYSPSGRPAALIAMETATTWKAYRNTMPRYANQFAFRCGGAPTAVDCRDNLLSGYDTGSGQALFDTGTTVGPSLNQSYASDVSLNRVDLATAARLNAYTSSTTLTASDAEAVMIMQNASAGTITIPTDASASMKIGTRIEVVKDTSAAISFVAASGVTLKARGNVLTMGTQFSFATLRKVAANTWLLVLDY